TKVHRAVFDESHHLWRLELNNGSTMTTRFIISASGGLISPKDPDIPGLENFGGQKIHTGHWDASVDLEGKRVAVIGTGATAVQLIPEIAKKAAHLEVYQRTPIWVLPKPDGEIPSVAKSAFSNIPLLQKSVRMGTDIVSETLMVVSAIYYKQVPWLVRWAESTGVKHMKRQLPNHPNLWEALTPKYGFSCKRPTFSNEYFETYAKDNVKLVTTPIEQIQKKGIKTTDGKIHQIDILILATGYRVFEKGNLPSYEVIGTNNRDLGEFWENDRYMAYEGVSVPAYPNF